MSKIELKIVHAADCVYRGIIRVALRSVNARDKRSLRVLDFRLKKAEVLRKAGRDLILKAVELETEAHKKYDSGTPEITESYNLLENLLEDLPSTKV